MKKVISVVGARPNFMKVAPIHRAFDKYEDIQHIICHTGQHYDKGMSDAFFNDLDMPEPAYFLNVGSGTHAVQTAKIMIEFEKVCIDANPDLVIVVGDVNSTIACALVAIKLGIKTAHVEAGLRSRERSMPEEINRIATDSISDYCFITEKSGMENLEQEGFPKENTFFTGNTMIDSQHYAKNKARDSEIAGKIGVNEGEFVLSTIHRPSNVDDKEQLEGIINIFANLAKHRKIVLPIHPRTRKNIDKFGLSGIVDSIDDLIFIEPLGYIDFLSLMMKADFVLTDSGGIQEETTALGVPCITIRPTTERPITCEVGTNILIRPVPEKIQTAVDAMLNKPRKKGEIPYLWDGRAAERIAEIVSEKFFKS